jgi:hypothetical protein
VTGWLSLARRQTPNRDVDSSFFITRTEVRLLDYAALGAAALLLGTTGLSHAAQIGSPALPTGTLTAGACYIRNVGADPIAVKVKLFENFGSELALSFQNCNDVPLAPGRTCVLLVNDLPDDVFFWCSATASVTGLRGKLRGTIELRAITGSGLRVIIAEDLR